MLSSTADQKTALEAGAQIVMKKPPDVSELMTTIDKLAKTTASAKQPPKLLSSLRILKKWASGPILFLYASITKTPTRAGLPVTPLINRHVERSETSLTIEKDPSLEA